MKTPQKNLPYILFITGPTASGKTDLSLAIAQKLSKHVSRDAEIINADIGQFYTPLTIGTAKPDWRSQPVKHHLFDIVDTPKDFNVVSYKTLLLKKIHDIWNQKKLPIVVGGSLFYIRSLFFPPRGGSETSPARSQPVETEPDRSEEKPQGLWDRLNKIDPLRAAQLHPGDIYRISRALIIWEETGKKPSQLRPEFRPEFHSRIIFLAPERETLYERINHRTELMMSTWLDEVKSLKNTEWEPFLKEKKLIGYPQIFAWLEGGGKKELSPALVADIQQKTRNYAKRQVTFWKKFRTLLMGHAQKSHNLVREESVSSVDQKQVEALVTRVSSDIQEVKRREIL